MIYSLADLGWSQRRIASELGINRETAGWYLRLAKSANSSDIGFQETSVGGALRCNKQVLVAS
jgi:orotate phosphoribosyltransferase-like protein